MPSFKTDALYLLEMYDKRNDADAYCNLIVVDQTNTLYAANIIDVHHKVKEIAYRMQDAKTGRVRIAEGNIYANTRLYPYHNVHVLGKNQYDEHELKMEDMTQILLVAKCAKVDLKARQEWEKEERERLSRGEEARDVPPDFSELVLAWDGDFKEQIFRILDDRYNTPMLREWKDYIVDQCIDRQYYRPLVTKCFGSDFALEAGLLLISESQLEEIISEGIASYELDFAVEQDDKVAPVLDQCTNIDTYLTNFAGDLGQRIQENIQLRFDPNREPHSPAFRITNLHANRQGITGLFPPQADVTMGIANTLLEDKYCFMIGEMGTGKTPVGTVIPFITESRFYAKRIQHLRQTTGRASLQAAAKRRLLAEGKISCTAGIYSKEFKQAFQTWYSSSEDHQAIYRQYLAEAQAPTREEKYLDPYRAIVFSPAIMVKKWVREISERIPDCKVSEITSWLDVLALQSQPKKPTQIEYYVLSNELVKQDFLMEPIMDWRTSKQDLEEAMDRYNGAMLRYAQTGDAADRPTRPRVRFRWQINHNVYASEANRRELVSSYTGYHCPQCGQALRKGTGGEVAGYRYYETRNKGEWKFKIKQGNRDNNYVCTNTVNTADLPKELIKDPSKRTQECGFILWQPVKLASNSLRRKISPAKAINRFLPRGFFKYLIADEVHEYKAEDSNIANAFGQLVSATTKQVLLTGTLMGGMASDIFYLLARLDSKRLKKESITFRDENVFTERYGVWEHTYKEEDRGRGVTRYKKGRIKKPGVSPHLFPIYLLRNAGFLELADLGYALPPYQEIPIQVDMSEEHRRHYDALDTELGNMMRQNAYLGGMKYVSKYINTMYQYADTPFNVPVITGENEQGESVELATPYNFDMNSFTPSKYNALLDIIEQELNHVDEETGEPQKRKVLVYVKHTGKNSFNQVDKYLYNKLKRDGYNVGILCSSGSYDGIEMKSQEEREQWIKDMMKERDWDILITNPKLVEVGLDLLMFPTIVYYQMNYSTYNYMQSSRRSWRIKQTVPVKVYTLTYRNTIQSKALEHIAKKIDAALAMQGKFSEEGLRAMAEGEDGMNALAKQLMKDDVLAETTSVEDRWRRINATYEELQSASYSEYESYNQEVMNPLGMEEVNRIRQSLIAGLVEDVASGKISQDVLDRFIERISDMLQEADTKNYNKGLKKKDRAIEGQYELALFD